MTIRSDLAHRRAVETRLLSQRRGVGRIPALPRTPGEQRFPAAVSQEGMWQELSRQEGGRHWPS